MRIPVLELSLGNRLIIFGNYYSIYELIRLDEHDRSAVRIKYGQARHVMQEIEVGIHQMVDIEEEYRNES